jgi:hypothetical protein
MLLALHLLLESLNSIQPRNKHDVWIPIIIIL